MKSFRKAVQYGWNTKRTWWFTATARTRDRFARTALGSFWLGLSNLLSVAVLGFVYGRVFKVNDFGNYIVYLGLGITIWNSIATSIQSAPALFRSNAGSLKNTNIHQVFYTLEEWAFQMQTFSQSFALVIIVLTALNTHLIPNLFTVGLLPMINLIIFMYWFPVLLCLAGAYFEDFYQLVPIVVQLSFLLSPILYEKKALAQLSWTADLNPIYIILSSLRNSLIEGRIHIGHTVIITVFNVIGVITSLKILERQRRNLPFLV